MTIDEVLLPVMIPVAIGIAVIATILMLVRLARLYPSVPKRVPLHIRKDGRPSNRTTGKAVLWVAPGILALVLVLLVVRAVVSAPPENERAVIALVFVILAECAWYVSWAIDRQIEMARKMTYRIAPGRMLRAILPVLLTVAVTIFIAARV